MNPEYQKIFPRRPPRLSRRFENLRPVFFVTFNTYERQLVLANPEIHETFIEYIRRGLEYGMIVSHYVIMPDHIHLFVCLNRENCGLKRFVRGLKDRLGKVLLSQGHGMPHWQEGFFDHLLRSDENYVEKADYIWNNPRRAGLTGDGEKWPYLGKVNDLIIL